MQRYKSIGQFLVLGLLLLAGPLLSAKADTLGGPRIEIVPNLGHLNDIHEAVFSPDGARVMSADGGGVIRIWDIATGNVIQTLHGHRGIIDSVSFSRDGAHVLSSGSDGMKLWNTSSGQLIRAFEHPDSGSFASGVISPNGAYILSGGSSDGNARLWEVETGRQIQTFAHGEQYDKVESVAFSPNGIHVLTGGAGSKPAKLWDARTGDLIRTFGAPLKYPLGNKVAFSPSGDRIILGDGETLTVWETSSGRLIQTLEGAEWRGVAFAAFSPDGALMMSAAHNGARVWDAKSGQLVRSLPHEGARLLAISVDGTRVISGGKTLTLWNLGAARPVRDFVGLSHPITSIAVSPDGSRLVSGGTGGMIGLWDTAVGKLVWNGRLQGDLRADGRVAAVSISSGKATAVSHRSVRLEMWNAETGEPLYAFSGYSSGNGIAFSSDGTRIVAEGDHKAVDLRATSLLADHQRVGSGHG